MSKRMGNVMLILCFNLVQLFCVIRSSEILDVDFSGVEEQHSTVNISCYIEEKEINSVNWFWNNTQMTERCTLTGSGGERLEILPNCSDTPLGPANYSFQIKSLDVEKDYGTVWECRYQEEKASLEFNFEIYKARENMISVESERELFERNQPITLTAEIDCAYPQDDILWCMTDEWDFGKSKHICFDGSRNWEDYFQNEPVITQESFSCIDEYGTDAIRSQVSTFKAKSVAKAGRHWMKFDMATSGFSKPAQHNGKEVRFNLCLCCWAVWLIFVVVVVCVGFTTALILLLVYFCWYKKKKNRTEEAMNMGYKY